MFLVVAEFFYALRRALVRAKSAAFALRVVNVREVVLHGDSTMRAHFCAKSTAQATHFTDGLDVFCSPQTVGASDVNFCIGRNPLDERFRASENAFATGDTPILVHDGKAVHSDFNRMSRASVRAGAHAEASPLTLFSISRAALKIS